MKSWPPCIFCIIGIHKMLMTIITMTTSLESDTINGLSLNTLDTNGNCQRPVFSLGVSHHMHQKTNLWKFELNLSSEFQDNYERKEKKHLPHEVVCFQKLDFVTSNSKSEVSKSNSWKIYFFLEKYVTSEGAIYHNDLYYQPLPITRNQVRFLCW